MPICKDGKLIHICEYLECQCFTCADKSICGDCLNCEDWVSKGCTRYTPIKEIKKESN